MIQTRRPGWQTNTGRTMNIENLRTIVWQQFGAAVDMLENAIQSCPDECWRDSLFNDPTDVPEYTEYWFLAYHTLHWLNRYVSGSPEGFVPPAPFVAGKLPEKPYTREELLDYLKLCREKARTIFKTLTDEKAVQVCKFPWGEEVGFLELQIYSMRHVQEHTAQLSLHIGDKVGGELVDWVARASR
jgi:hypothetical protein